MLASVVSCRPVSEPPKELLAFVERQIRKASIDRCPNRRREERHAIVVPVTVQPVDERFSAIGEPFVVVTRDISEKGIGLVHSEPIAHGLLALQTSLAGEDVTVIARVAWCGELGPYYSIGCEVIARLRNLPTRHIDDGASDSGPAFARPQRSVAWANA